jgi:hypothetical protein
LIYRLALADERIVKVTEKKDKAKEQLREVLEEREYSLNRSTDSGEMRRILEHEMEVRVKVETELQNLHKVSPLRPRFYLCTPSLSSLSFLSSLSKTLLHSPLLSHSLLSFLHFHPSLPLSFY